MKKMLLVLLTILLLTMSFVSLATALEPGDPVGDCPPKWEMHMMGHHGEHNGEHHAGHLHVGVDTDRNGDGYVCVNHVGLDEKVHVHTDNNIPLR